jgi:hypothetical protein
MNLTLPTLPVAQPLCHPKNPAPHLACTPVLFRHTQHRHPHVSSTALACTSLSAIPPSSCLIDAQHCLSHLCAQTRDPGPATRAVVHIRRQPRFKPQELFFPRVLYIFALRGQRCVCLFSKEFQEALGRVKAVSRIWIKSYFMHGDTHYCQVCCPPGSFSSCQTWDVSLLAIRPGN